MPSAKEVVQRDLDYICDSLREELPLLRGKRLLMTGGAGFLGHYIVQTLLHANKRAKDQISLTVYDSYVRGIPSWLSDLSNDKNLTLVRHDIVHPLPKDLPDFAHVIHAASIASPTFYRQHPIETMDANVNGLRHLLDYFREQQNRSRDVSGFLFFSSSEIYGDPTPGNIPTLETYRGNVSCTGPRACYDEAKRYGETLCVNFAEQYRLPIKVARPFNNYGPGLKISDRRVIPDYARDVMRGRDITMLSDGSPKRTFCYVADAVIGYLKILVKGRPGEAYNIGVEEPEVSMAELAERIVAISRGLFGYRGRVVLQQSKDPNYLVDNPGRRCPSIEKARRELGFSPQIELHEGLTRALTWYSENRESEDL